MNALKSKKLLNIIPLIWTIAVTLCCLWRNLQNINLWHDEAMLAWSISQRNLAGLISEPLAYNQSAPLIYIILVKLFTIIFGNSEFVLRLPSLLSYILLLYLCYLIAGKILGHSMALWEVAFISTISIILTYTGEFKQYLTEGAIVLLVLLLYEKTDWFRFIVISAVLIGFGNPVCFLLGGILLYEFTEGCVRKDKIRIKRAVTGGIIIMAVFIMYYLYWLRPVINDGYMVDFWADFKPVFGDRREILHTLTLFKTMLDPFGIFGIPIACISIACVIYNLIKVRKRTILIFFASFVVAMAASVMGMFPLKDRLWLFAYPILVMICFEGLILACQRSDKKAVIFVPVIFTILFLCMAQRKVTAWFEPDGLVIPREEIRNSINYVRDNIREDEKCYVYYDALPAFWYENGYDNHSIGKYDNNLIFGKGFFYNDDNREDIGEIIKTGKCYILIAHRNTSGDRYANLLAALENSGDLVLVMENFGTPLYYYNAKKG